MHAGFVEEMRFVAMKLHTKDQAPKEGGQKAAEQPFQKVTWHHPCIPICHIATVVGHAAGPCASCCSTTCYICPV